MPYLRITCPELPRERRTLIAARVTDAINDLFFCSQAGMTREELREHTTVHFTPYGDGELFIGGRTPRERGAVDLTVERSDWNMPVHQQRKVAQVLTPALAELFDVPSEQIDGVNIRFHFYPPSAFAVGGRLLSDVVPRVGQLAKRVFG